MELSNIVKKMQAAVERAGGLDRSVKFDFGDDGQITASGKDVKAEDGEANCTISVSKDDFISLVQGDLDPMAAFMSGKLKVTGDMSVAMGLQSLFSST
ncbi:MAG: SCP2 sterol-binding domain-containing protein [Hyphomonadaceae bacterium]|nr:SCP2 sterol-binding domain-containing protein [Hyphomonadaceae bacterium]MBC6413211.1 SCP2 sterol-binding domain-containing protein [Hyphomonadaceae bacterium]